MTMKFAKAFSLIAIMLLSLTACDRDEGGMEEMVEKMDEAATAFGNAVEAGCEDMKECVNADDTDC